MKSEQWARTGFWVAQVPKKSFLAGTFIMIDEELIPACQMLGWAQGVFLRLISNTT